MRQEKLKPGLAKRGVRYIFIKKSSCQKTKNYLSNFIKNSGAFKIPQRHTRILYAYMYNFIF